MTKPVPVRVCRATEVPLGGDLFGWIDVVWEAVARDYESFGAREVWDVWPMEVHLDHVIVQDMSKGKFYRADLTVDSEKETVGFGNIQRVVNQWVPAEDGQVEREESDPAPASDLQTVLVQRKGAGGSLFGDLFQ